MKIRLNNNPSIENDFVTVQPSVRVCMYVLRESRSDVRAMRSARALVEEGFEVSIIDVEAERARSMEDDIEGIRVKHIIMPGWHTSRRFELWFFVIAVRTFILSLLWLLQSRADIYHANEVTALPACYIAAQLRRKPLIFEAYELPPPLTSIAFWRRLNGLLVRLLTLMLPRCAGVITTSPFYAREIRKRFRVADVWVVRNVPEYRAVQKSDRLRRYLGLNADTRIALYQGILHPNRGLDTLIRASVFLEGNIVIVLMGKDAEATQKQLEALIALLGTADRVKIIPPVPYEELLDWTSSADIGLSVLPLDYSLSIRLTLPNKLFEYIMAGVPILTSQLDAVAEVIDTYDVGRIVRSLAPRDVGAAIDAMLSDQVALARMRRNALNAAQEFCWEKERERLLGLYRRIVAGWGTKTAPVGQSERESALQDE